MVDAEGALGGFNGEDVAGVGDADVDALTGDDQGSSAADAAFDPQRFGCRRRWWSGGAGVAEAGDLGGAEGVGQAAQEDTVGGDLHEAAVESDGDASAGEVVTDGVLPASEADHAGGVDEPFDLDRGASPDGTCGDRWWPGGLAVVGEQLPQVGWVSRDGTALSRTPSMSRWTTVVLAQGDRESGSGGAKPELLPADGEGARGGRARGAARAKRRRGQLRMVSPHPCPMQRATPVNSGTLGDSKMTARPSTTSDMAGQRLGQAVHQSDARHLPS